MRLTQLFSWLLLCGTLAFFATTASAQGTRVAGRIVAAKVTGTVNALNTSDQTQRQLATGDALTQNTRVTTAAASSVILVFSNGASLNLGADSSMDIEEFLQDPFAEEVAVASLTQEPTSSTTKLNLTRGELVGDVKKLNQAGGSTFTVNTPVGAAGIRGTTFRIIFRPDASGRVFFTLSTSEGVVLFEAPAAAGVSVETGNEVVVDVEVTIDAATGTVTVTAPPEVAAATPIPAETQAAMAKTSQEIVEAAATVILSTVSSSTAPSGDSGTKEGGDDSEEKTEKETTEKESTEQETTETPDNNQKSDQKGLETEPVFNPTVPQNQTTSGDGKSA